MKSTQRNLSMKAVNAAQQGFTLIELMIVVAIIGILAAVALPAYNDYTQRAQISEAFTAAEGMKTAISEFTQTNGVYPAATDIANGIGAGVGGKYSDAVTTAGTGVVIVTMKAAGIVGADVAGATITFTPPATVAGATNFQFVCTSTAKQKYLPKTCTGT
ncbi:pilin [Undibacterium sp.]|uniref:pilin n=1 Tax=Undibacterium sp. TaxID=1914977 RepID=UPI002BCEB756|nr:pilin [Undibacterium sp.]HTD02297.1 pilin [Undibacterium sp.]